MDERLLQYHKKQFEKTYRSTEVFVKWLEDLNYLKKTGKMQICDMACGGGSE
jgi:2-polyprenyl-3-methyl-5-hydroxy-6-metoxy-1,4-benzoquinol methylase